MQRSLKLNEAIRVRPYSNATGILMRRGRDTRNDHTEKKGRVRTHKEGSHLKARKTGCTKKKNPAGTLLLDFQLTGL